ncbi:MAG: condensation domain-containing protein [Bacteroidota bacterium]
MNSSPTHAAVDYLTEITPLPPAEDYPVSRVQTGHWVMHHYTKDKRHFNTWITERIPFFDPVVARATLETVIRRHDLLRTTYTYRDGAPRQVIHPFEDFADAIQFSREDADSATVMARLEREAYNYAFDPIAGPMFYVKMVETSEEVVFIFNIDHSIGDEQSKASLRNEIFTLYRAYLQGEENPLSPPRVQYRDFVRWHRALIAERTTQQFREYWYRYTVQQLPAATLSTWAGRPVATERYTDLMERQLREFLKPMPAEHEALVYGSLAKLQFLEARAYCFVIPSDLHRGLRRLAKEEGTSLYNVLSLGFHLLVYRLTGCDDSVLGVNMPMRNNEDLLSMVGFLINTVLVRNRVRPEASLRENLSATVADNLDTAELAFYPLEYLLRDFDLPFPAISHIFINMINKEESEKQRIKDFGARHLDNKVWMNYFDLDFHIAEQKNGIEIVCEYVAEIFSPTQIEQIHATLVEVLSMLAFRTEEPLAEVFHSHS